MQLNSETVTLNEAIEDYAEQRLVRFSSAETRDAHEGAIERFRTWATRETQPNVYLADIDQRLMARYFERLRPPAYKARTFNNYRQYLMSFFLYCRGEGYINRNPMRHIDAARVPQVQRRVLSAAELQSLLEGEENPRDRAALAVGINTALRSGDIATLQVGHVNLVSDELTAWIEKTDKTEVFPITAELHDELGRWLKVYAETMGVEVRRLPNDWTLLPPFVRGGTPNRSDRPYNVHAKHTHLELIVHRALQRIDLDGKGEGWHTIRRSTGRIAHEVAMHDSTIEGEPIRVVQALYGHKHQATTELYLGLTFERRQRDRMLRGRSFLGRAIDLDDQRRDPDDGAGPLAAVR